MGFSLPYAWVLECASHLHYHFIVWLPRGHKLNQAKLSSFWPWGSTWLEICRSVGAWARYMAKFNSVAKLPRGARLFGYGGLDEIGKMAVSRAGLPRWLLALLPVGHGGSRYAGGGWVDMV